jgi:acyl carrier protein
VERRAAVVSSPEAGAGSRTPPSARGASLHEVTREQVYELIRDHLADELDIDPDEIGEESRFKEDLEADSLDLYTLVQELEDTYGVQISDERAAEIKTVGQAVDFVLAQAPAEV